MWCCGTRGWRRQTLLLTQRAASFAVIPVGRLKLPPAYDQPDKNDMEQKKNWEGDKPLNKDKKLLEGSWAVSDPVGMASVEPLSLKEQLGEEGVGEERINGSSGTVPTEWEALVRGRAGLELTEDREGRK